MRAGFPGWMGLKLEKSIGGAAEGGPIVGSSGEPKTGSSSSWREVLVEKGDRRLFMGELDERI